MDKGKKGGEGVLQPQAERVARYGGLFTPPHKVTLTILSLHCI